MAQFDPNPDQSLSVSPSTVAQLGMLISDTRKAQGLSAALLARRAGINRVTLYRLEQGRVSDIGFVRVQRLLDVLGLQQYLGLKQPLQPDTEDVCGE